MATIDTLVIGAGQAGLAMSRSLSDRGVDHVVLERGRIAERWRSERWDSLRLLTPNWMTRLPGWTYDGPEPDGFMTKDEVVTFFDRYARASDAPVQEESAVERVTRHGDGFEVVTSDATWQAANVVMATGWCDRPAVPAMARHLHPAVHQLSPSRYRNPDGLPAGAVLVVGASATGVQIAEELARAGRDVVLAVGRHTRLPRRYRGMDVWWWLERIGNFDKSIDAVADPAAARHEPSAQLVARDDGSAIDLASLQAVGVRLTGRLTGITGRHAELADDLAVTTADADRRLGCVLDKIDRHIADHGLEGEVLPPEPVAASPRVGATTRLDLADPGVGTVVWATGYRRSYPWLQVPVLDAAGEIRQRRGVTPVPGLYVLGQRFQHFRNSNFIDGVGRDAAFVADVITHRTDCGGRATATTAAP